MLFVFERIAYLQGSFFIGHGKYSINWRVDMAVTRIKNNQITDASGANTQLGVNAAVKLQNYTVTATKIANNLVYGSDLTVTGNLTVQGNTTTIDTTITTIEDPVIVLASTQTSGAPTVDIGYLGYRGNQSNIAFVWDESADEFVTAFTDTGETSTTINITSYANFHTNNANIGGNLTVGGNIDITGNVSNLTVTGNVTGGNLLTSGLVSATGNVTGGNINTGGQVVATSNITGGNLLTGGLISATSTITSAANITGGNILTGGIVSATGNVTGGNIDTAGAITATGNIAGGNIVTVGVVSATGNVTGDYILGNGYFLTGVANSETANRLVNGTSNVDIPSANGNVTFGVGGTDNVVVVASTGIFTTGVASATGNITGGNLLTPGLISAAGLATSGNIETAGYVSAAGNVIADNVNTDNVVSTGAITISTGANGNINLSTNGTGNVVLSNTYINGLQLNPVQDTDAASKYYVDQLAATGLTYHEAVVVATTADLATTTGGTITYNQPNGAGNGIGATLTTTGSFNIIDSSNVQTLGTRILVKNEGNAVFNGVYTWSNATVITRSTDADEYGLNSADALSLNSYFFVSGGNINLGSAYVVDAPSGTITFGTSNIQFAQFSQAQIYSANTSAGLILVGQTFSAKVDNNTTAFDGGGNISVKAGANLTTPNIGDATGTSFSSTGNISTGGNLIASGYVTATGNVTGGNILTGGLISATGAVTSGGFTTTGNVTGGNLLFGSGIVSGTGNIYADTIFANISGNIDAGGANTEIQFNDSDTLAGNPGFTFNKVGNIVTANGNITGANLFTGGSVSATANITGGNLLTGGLISATSTITSAANVTGGNITTAGEVTATGNVTGGNVNTAGLITATGNIYGGNLILAGAALDTSAGRLTVNSTLADADFAVNGGLANVFYVDAGTNTASFGSSTQTTNAIVAFNATNSVLMPVGNTAQRPGTGVTGMLRFNTTDDNLEIYNNTGWEAVGVPAFTVIADEQFNGDGSTVAFTLATSQTTNSCIVSINGVIQIPTLAYSVSTTTLTFTEAPAPGDVIDVRQITTTTTVTSISNTSGNAEVGVSGTSATVRITGDLIPTGNLTQTLGNATNRWSNLYVGGNTIFLGNLQLKEQSATTFAVFQADGVTQANIDAGAIDVSAITSGTSTVGIYGTGQTYMTVNGNANVLLASNTSVTVNGALTATGNVVGANVTTAGLISATGNITGGNITTAGRLFVTAGTDNIELLNGVISASGNISGGNLNVTGNIVDTAALEIITGSNGNITLSPNGTGVIVANKDIRNGQANGVGNIGASGASFNTIFAKATSAQYADLAEKYTADADYAPGTVVMFGGSAEITLCVNDACSRVAGVISTNPSYRMNDGLVSEHTAMVALTGRVPTKVTGKIRKGDLMVSAGNGLARAAADAKIGTVIGKALEDFDGAEGVIEVVVGRL
jgi:hypothetical protein